VLKSILQKVGFVAALILMQTSFFSGLGLPFSQFNFVLSCLIFLGFIFSFRRALIYGIVVGLLLEAYSGLPFGAATLSLLIPLWVGRYVFSRFLTNRSFYTIIILAGMCTLICQLVLLFYLSWDVFLGSKVLLPNFLWQSFLANTLYSEVLNATFIAILYFIFSLTTRQFEAIVDVQTNIETGIVNRNR
jgi:rod shape-determining protein MreD